MKNIVFVLAGISGPHPCASRSTSLTFALSQYYPSLLLSNDTNSDVLYMSLLMTSPAKFHKRGVHMLGMGDCAICWTVYPYLLAR